MAHEFDPQRLGEPPAQITDTHLADGNNSDSAAEGLRDHQASPNGHDRHGHRECFHHLNGDLTSIGHPRGAERLRQIDSQLNGAWGHSVTAGAQQLSSCPKPAISIEIRAHPTTCRFLAISEHRRQARTLLGSRSGRNLIDPARRQIVQKIIGGIPSVSVAMTGRSATGSASRRLVAVAAWRCSRNLPNTARAPCRRTSRAASSSR